MSVVCLRCAIGKSDGINPLFFYIVELNNTSDMTLKETILQILKKYEIDFNF